MLIIGLTGSVGTGKSATARMFLKHGIPVYDADLAVHRLYNKGAAVAPLAEAFPGCVKDDVVDREFLARVVLADRPALQRLEAIVHPLVHAAERNFLAAARGKGSVMALIEIPLLLETGGEKRCNIVVVTSAPAQIQRERVLARPAMNEEKLDKILARQLPDEEKRRRAHFIVETRFGFDAAQKQVDDIVRALSSMAASDRQEPDAT